MNFFDGVLEQEEGFTPENPVYQALYVSEDHAMDTLDALDAPIPLRDAGPCLRKILQDGSVKLFQQVLAHSAWGETVDTVYLPFRQMGWGVHGSGSMLMLAAMMDRPEQASLLLEKGYDCNGAGLNLAEAFRRDDRYTGEGYTPYSRCSGTDGSYVHVMNPKQAPVGLCCATPLSAALLCGSLNTAEVLLRCPDLWKKESTAVCRAAVLILDGMTQGALPEGRHENQREILRRIFTPEQRCLPDRETFLRSVYLQPSCFVDVCRTDTLRCQLESGLCTEQDAREMLEVLSRSMWRFGREYDRKRAAKLLLLKQHFPRLCREDWVTGIFLRECARRIREKLPYQTVLNAWKQLSGKERDLTWISGDLWAFRWAKLRQFLDAAGENGTLVMDADAMNRWYGASSRCMAELLKRVQFRQRDGEGVSGMMQHLLAIGDLRLLQQASRGGLLEREDPRMLMECITELDHCNQNLRAMVLTSAKNHRDAEEPKANWKNPRRWEQWCLWELISDEEAEKLLHALLYGELSREDRLRSMFRMHQYLGRGSFAPDLYLRHPEYPSLQADSLAAFACCAENSGMLTLLLEHLPETLQRTVQVKWGDDFFFRGTPLTLAAAMGRTEQVKLLLDSGSCADEAGRGDHSRFYAHRKHFHENGFPVTPVLAAILFGREETAKLLLERGACCDFSRPEHRRVLRKGSAESLQLAESLPNVGFEKIPTAELEAMRLMTLPQGERTLFWKNLRQQFAEG